MSSDGWGERRATGERAEVEEGEEKRPVGAFVRSER